MIRHNGGGVVLWLSMTMMISSLSSWYVEAVPVLFGARGSGKGKDEDGSKGGRNSVVDEFFSVPTIDNDDDKVCHERLQDEIHSLAIQHRKDGGSGVYEDLASFLVETRRRLHRHPELMYQEEQTSATIQSILTELNIDFTTGWSKNTHQDVIPGPGGYGIVADIGSSSGSSDGPCILLRADMDALPIHEVTAVDFQSEEEGKMHACGHDAHTTMLLGAAAVLKQMEHSLPGTVRLMFQPAEEGGAGAKRMVEEGVLTQSPPVSHAYAMHVWPTLPSGTIAARPGALMAAADSFEIILTGKGGHAAMPHLTIDPVVAASSLVMNLQTIVSRTMSPLESGVVSITQIKAGQDVFNVIPSTAVLKGTIRALSTETLSFLREKVQTMVQTTASLYQCNSTITYSPDFYPPTINDPTLFDFSKSVAALVSKEGYVRDDIEPTMGGEDFAFVAQSVPSTFFFLGQGGGTTTTTTTNHPKKQLRTNYGLHHPQFALDEDIMPQGVELHVTLALRTMKKLLLEKKQQPLTTSNQQ